MRTPPQMKMLLQMIEGIAAVVIVDEGWKIAVLAGAACFSRTAGSSARSAAAHMPKPERNTKRCVSQRCGEKTRRGMSEWAEDPQRCTAFDYGTLQGMSRARCYFNATRKYLVALNLVIPGNDAILLFFQFSKT